MKLFPNLEAVSASVNSGDVDMVYGLDTIDPDFFQGLQAKGDSDNWATLVSGPLSTRVLRFNSGSELLSSLAVRKALLHAVNKQVNETGGWAVGELPVCKLVEGDSWGLCGKGRFGGKQLVVMQIKSVYS